jgi:hypothetical protein
VCLHNDLSVASIRNIADAGGGSGRIDLPSAILIQPMNKEKMFLQRRDFKRHNFNSRAESILSPLAGLKSFSDRYPTLAPHKGKA